MFDRRVEDITVGVLNTLVGIDYYNQLVGVGRPHEAGTVSCNRILHKCVKQALSSMNRTEKFSVFSGVYRTTVVFDTFVVKFAHEEPADDFEDELQFISEMTASGFGRHFPESVVVPFNDDAANDNGSNGPAVVLVQERIARIGREHRKLTPLAARFAETIGVGDSHVHNYGWKTSPDGIEYPVFVDIQRRFGSNPSKSIPWEQYVVEEEKRKCERKNRKRNKRTWWTTYAQDDLTPTYT